MTRGRIQVRSQRRKPRRWAVARLLGGAVVLGALAWRLGAEPFVAGVRATTGPAAALAVLLVAATTVAGAWRWRVVARGFGVDLSLGDATAACYRSQFLNSVLPGGVLGDVQRGVSHGRAAGAVRAVVLSVVWERVAGQTVQVAASLLVVLVLWPLPLGGWTAPLAVACSVAVVVAGLVLARLSIQGALGRRAVGGVLLASLLAAGGHGLVFLVAADAAGVTAPVSTLLPLALVVLVAAAIPLNVAGWGPREGVAAWAFATTGLGAATGTTVAVAYAVLSLVATLPGAVLLLVRRPRATRSAAVRRVEVGARG